MGKQEEMQNKYVEARLAGANGEEAKRVAGYSPTSPVKLLEKPGGAIAEKLARALEKYGIDEDFLAHELIDCLEKSKEHGSKEKNLNASALLLRQMAHLLGHGKASPAVAVQINNTVEGSGEKPVTLDPREVADALERLIRSLQEAGSKAGPEDVHDGDPGSANAPAHDGVAEPVEPQQATGGGGEP